MKTTKLNTKYLIEEGPNRAIVQINHTTNSHSIWRIRVKTDEFLKACEEFGKQISEKETNDFLQEIENFGKAFKEVTKSKRTIPDVPKNERFKLDEGID